MKGAGTNDSLLVRIIVSRSEVGVGRKGGEDKHESRISSFSSLSYYKLKDIGTYLTCTRGTTCFCDTKLTPKCGKGTSQGLNDLRNKFVIERVYSIRQTLFLEL